MTDETEQNPLRALPQVDVLLRTEPARRLRESVGARRLAELARGVTEGLRSDIRTGALRPEGQGGDALREELLREGARRLERVAADDRGRGLRRVINATGVVLHTNLGRAPLSEAARHAVSRMAGGYCTLEYDMASGARGRRGGRVGELLTELTGAEDGLVVNNCAAAALLTLTALARDGESIVSRGELVEIGGDFRVPDVMAQSGTLMVEVGTTNRTRLSDYECAINERTRLILRVHPSNYRIVGFTAAPDLGELSGLARRRGLTLFEDAGSGALFDLTPHGLAGEPAIGESISRGADVVAFSGDKLLGGAQAGLLVGRREFIDRLRRHPLYRALRADKLALAALEATLEAYRRGSALEEVPALRMLAQTYEEIEGRARAFVSRAEGAALSPGLRCEIVDGRSAVGGGSAPTVHPRTALVALAHDSLSADALERALRSSDPPVIARVAEGKVLLDLRTVAENEEGELLGALCGLPDRHGSGD